MLVKGLGIITPFRKGIVERGITTMSFQEQNSIINGFKQKFVCESVPHIPVETFCSLFNRKFERLSGEQVDLNPGLDIYTIRHNLVKFGDLSLDLRSMIPNGMLVPEDDVSVIYKCIINPAGTVLNPAENKKFSLPFHRDPVYLRFLCRRTFKYAGETQGIDLKRSSFEQVDSASVFSLRCPKNEVKNFNFSEGAIVFNPTYLHAVNCEMPAGSVALSVSVSLLGVPRRLLNR